MPNSGMFNNSMLRGMRPEDLIDLIKPKYEEGGNMPMISNNWQQSPNITTQQDIQSIRPAMEAASSGMNLGGPISQMRGPANSGIVDEISGGQFSSRLNLDILWKLLLDEKERQRQMNQGMF